MFTIKYFSVFTLLAVFMHMVSAHPVVLDLSPRTPTPAPAAVPPLQAPASQTPLASGSSSANSTTSLHTLQDLYEGNKKFLQNVRVETTRLIDEAPSFMFLGCADNRLSPSTLFNAPTGSLISHDNIANQYSTKDPSANAAVAYAIESLHVQHIIVLGHYGCKGVETAITKSTTASRMVRDWVKPISDLYSKSRRQEIVVLRDSRMPHRGLDKGATTAPPASDPGFRALVEENVKHGVKQLRQNDILAKAYAKGVKNQDVNVFVHGFVYDEATGKVFDLNVSFGPPGKAIPHVPFEALKAAQNFHRDSKPDKEWDFGKSH